MTFRTLTPVALALLVATCGCSASAQSRGQRDLGRTTVHPRGVDAAMTEREILVAIDDQGRQRLRDQLRWEILTDYALDNHSDPEVLFDSSRQRLDVAVARTKRPDGVVTETPPAGINELLPRGLRSAPAYGSLRRTVISILGVEPGAEAELDYTVVDRTPTRWAPGGIVTAAGPMPIESLSVVLRSARGQLRSACVRCSERAERRGEGEHLWTFADVEPLDTYELGAHQGDGTPARLFVPRVVYSTAESWAVESAALAQRLDQAAQITDDVRARAWELGRDEASLWTTVEALQAFVATAIDTVDLPLARLGYAPPPAERVLSRSYGSELDKAVLLVTLLRAVEVEAEVVLLSEESRIATVLPWLGQLDHAWVVARTDGQERWMPVDRPLLLAPDQLAGDFWVLVPSQPSLPQEHPSSLCSPASTHLTAQLQLDGEGELRGELRLTHGGRSNPYFRLRASSSDPSRLLAPLATAIADGAEVTGPQIEQFGPTGTSVRGQIRARAEAEGDGTVIALSVPWPEVDLLEQVELRAQRQTPLVLDGPRRITLRMTLTLPQGFQLADEPVDREIRHRAGSIVQQASVDGRRLELERELVVTHRVVEPGEPYDQVRQVLAEAARLSREAILLVARAEPEETE